MFLELIAVFVAGFAGAGAMMLVNRISGGRLPRWLTPVAAGAAMLAAAISQEYSWFARTAATLPEGMAVAQSVETSAPWRPWTYVVPITTRFNAVDLAHMRANTDDATQRIAQVYFYSRWQPVQSVEFLIDCTGHRRADPALGDGGAPVWRDVGPDDPIVRTACAGA